MAGGLAINGNDFAQYQLVGTLRPCYKAFGQFAGVDPRNHPCYAIVGGDAILQRYPLAQPILLFFAERFYGFPAFRAADHRAYRQNDDVKQRVQLMPLYTRAFQG